MGMRTYGRSALASSRVVARTEAPSVGAGLTSGGTLSDANRLRGARGFMVILRWFHRGLMARTEHPSVGAGFTSGGTPERCVQFSRRVSTSILLVAGACVGC